MRPSKSRRWVNNGQKSVRVFVLPVSVFFSLMCDPRKNNRRLQCHQSFTFDALVHVKRPQIEVTFQLGAVHPLEQGRCD